MKKLVLENAQQVAIWSEMDGQLSDGHWENLRPHDHWKQWYDAEVSIGSPVGKNFYPVREQYDMLNKDLLDAVGYRMLQRARLVHAYGIWDERWDCLFDLNGELRLIEEGDELIQREKAALGEFVDRDGYWTKTRAKQLRILEMFGEEQIRKALKDETFTMRMLRKEIKGVMTCMRTQLPIAVTA
jgi:hypothetical protein